MTAPVPHLVRPRINLQITRDARGLVRVLVPETDLPNSNIPKSKSGRPVAGRGKPILIQRGSAVVRIYGRKPGPWTIAWREHSSGPRLRTMRSDLEKATALAEEKAIALANGDNALLAFSHADRASLERSRELLRPIGNPALEVAVGHYAKLIRRLLDASPSTTLDEAIGFFIEHQPRNVVPQNIPALVVSLIDEKRQKKRSEKWLRTLEQQLSRFAGKFACPLHALRAHEITAWLDSLRVTKKGRAGSPMPAAGPLVSLKTRQNFLSAIRELVHFGKAKGQLSKSWDELDRVDDIDLPPVEVQVYTPTQISKLLNTCEKTEAGQKLVPFIALTAFAGVRHEEIRDPNNFKPLLDWEDINLKRGMLKIKASAAKVKERRVIKMKPNLIAWLRSYAKHSGPVCEISNTSNALYRAKLKAGLPAGRGELTNALRSSYISYRLAETNDIGLVAREAGNSPGVIKDNYLELVEPEAAAEYFAVAPFQADVLPLFNWNR